MLKAAEGTATCTSNICACARACACVSISYVYRTQLDFVHHPHSHALCQLTYNNYERTYLHGTRNNQHHVATAETARKAAQSAGMTRGQGQGRDRGQTVRMRRGDTTLLLTMPCRAVPCLALLSYLPLFSSSVLSFSCITVLFSPGTLLLLHSSLLTDHILSHHYRHHAPPSHTTPHLKTP